MRPLVENLRRRFVMTALALGLTVLGSSCGLPDNLVLVNVTGLDTTVIRELRVTLTLDGAMARNSQPTADNPDTMSFAVYKNMQRFGVEIPAGTRQLGVSIDGLNTSRVVLSTGSGQADLTQRKDLDVALHAP